MVVSRETIRVSVVRSTDRNTSVLNSSLFAAIAVQKNTRDSVGGDGATYDIGFGGVDHVLHQAAAGEPVQHLRQRRLHPRTLAGGHDHDIQSHA